MHVISQNIDGGPTHYQKFADVHRLLYALLEFVFPANFDEA